MLERRNDMKEIKVEKQVFFLDKEKLWSISLRTVEPYGEFNPRHLYVTAIFHKKLDKALKMAWHEFDKAKEYQDNHDKFNHSKQTELVTITV